MFIIVKQPGTRCPAYDRLHPSQADVAQHNIKAGITPHDVNAGGMAYFTSLAVVYSQAARPDDHYRVASYRQRFCQISSSRSCTTHAIGTSIRNYFDKLRHSSLYSSRQRRQHIAKLCYHARRALLFQSARPRATRLNTRCCRPPSLPVTGLCADNCFCM